MNRVVFRNSNIRFSSDRKYFGKTQILSNIRNIFGKFFEFRKKFVKKLLVRNYFFFFRK